MPIEQLLHVFRNTPIGRETLLHSCHFCNQTGALLNVYVPQKAQFLMYFENRVVTVDLDESYLRSPETALRNAKEIIHSMGTEAFYLEPRIEATYNTPNIPMYFQYMCCPRSMSDVSSKIGMGHLGPRVRRLIQNASFPVLLASSCFRPWKQLAVLYGGSRNAFRALEWGLRLRALSGMPLHVYTYLGGEQPEYHESVMEGYDLGVPISDIRKHWTFFQEGSFEDKLLSIPNDALLIMGAYGHGLVKDMIFGSKLEMIQKEMPNSILIVGPHCIRQDHIASNPKRPIEGAGSYPEGIS